jgi:hypothetical protein
MLADVIYQQCSYSAPVICRCDGAIALLAGCIPDLSFSGFGIDLNAPGCEFNTDGGFGVQIEFISSKS